MTTHKVNHPSWKVTHGNPKTVTLTRDNIEAFMTRVGGVRKVQLDLLGLKCEKGWKSSLVGREIPEPVYAKLMALKGDRVDDRQTSMDWCG